MSGNLPPRLRYKEPPSVGDGDVVSAIRKPMKACRQPKRKT